MTRVALAALAVIAGCTELPEITTGVCGNGVVETLEDCDHTDGLCLDCSWRCNDDRACLEPGFRCGADSLCHAPGGYFERTPSNPTAFPVVGFRISDVDFDGYGDIVGLNATALNVRYGDDRGALARAYNVVTPQITGLPAPANLIAPGIDDLVLPTADGLVVYTGAFGVPTPRQFPLGGDEGPENMGDRPDPFDAVQVDDTIGLFGPDPNGNLTFGLIVITPRGPLFDVETGFLCADDAREPTNIALWHAAHIVGYKAASGTYVAFTNGAKTCVIKISRAASPIPRADGTTCPLSIPGAPDCQYQVESIRSFPAFVRRPVFADLDGDGCPSLMAHDAGLTMIDEYPGTDAGGCTIAASPHNVKLSIAAPPLSELIGSTRLVPPVPNAAPDALVSTYGIHAILAPPSSGPWDGDPLYMSDRPLLTAITGDIDNDGALDVVFSTQLPNLDIARRVPSSKHFLLVRTPTTGPVVQTMIADYDGDLRDDLAYVENVGPAQRLSIAYGNGAGLDAGIPADAFTRVVFMSTIQVPDSTDPFNLVDDLIVIDVVPTMDPQEPFKPEITILHGSPSRTMLSFFGLPVPLANAAFRGVVAGNFIGAIGADRRSVGITDLVAFQTFRGPACATEDCSAAVWVVPGHPNARFGAVQFVSTTGEPYLPGTQLVGDCLDGATSPFCIPAAKLVAWRVSPDHDIVLGIDFRFGEPPHVLRFDPAVSVRQTAPTIRDDIFPSEGRVHDAVVFDIDRDGLEELVVSFGSSVPTADNGHVKICRMHRDGTFDGECIDVASLLVGGDSSLRCVDAVVGSVLPACTPDGLLDQLVVLCRRVSYDDTGRVTSAESYVVPITFAGGTFIGTVADPVLTTPGALDQLQIGDVTGDAVDDIVVLDMFSGIPVLQLFAQKTTRQYDACIPD